MLKQSKQILLVGNPNVGKSSIFNILCNRKQKTGNYAGVTVSSSSGHYIFHDEEVTVIDLPGSYSVYPSSKDEKIFSDYLIEKKEMYAGIVYILDALSLKRGLLLLRQIQDLKIPILLVVNQIDEAKKRGIEINFALLEKKLNLKIFQTNAKKNIGIEELKKGIDDNNFLIEKKNIFNIPKEHFHLLGKQNSYENWMKIASGVIDDKSINPKRLQTQETIRRYQEINQILDGIILKKKQYKELFTEKLDKILVHKFWGYLIFGVMLTFIFQSVYILAEYPKGWIEDFFDFLGNYTAENLPQGPLNSLVSKGIIPGIGGVLPFAPQIGILLYFLFLLEDSGYMARVVFLMDRFLRPFGLNGKSIVPLVSGTACAIPAIMASRNIENPKERLLTILVTPFMTCTARLPIYTIIIDLVIPDKYFFGFIGYKALVLMFMYLLGFLMSIGAAFVLKITMKTKEKSFLIMDLPNYKIPLWKKDLKLTWDKIKSFISGAGKTIFAISIILWFLGYFGPKQKPNDQYFSSNVELKNSYLALIGKKFEPIVSPIGYDWKMGVGIITSFAARESFVGTLSLLYGLDGDVKTDEDMRKIESKMKNDIKPDGEKVFNLATGFSILIFYAFAMQCISTIAVVYQETKSKKWTIIQLFGMTGLAYISSFIIYQFFKIFF